MWGVPHPYYDPIPVDSEKSPKDGARCYFCGERAEWERNGIPQCGGCRERYTKTKGPQK